MYSSQPQTINQRSTPTIPRHELTLTHTNWNWIRLSNWLMVITFIAIGAILTDSYRNDANYTDKFSNNICLVNDTEVHTWFTIRNRKYILTANVVYVESDTTYEFRTEIDRKDDQNEALYLKQLYENTQNQCYTDGDKVYIDRPKPDNLNLVGGVTILSIGILTTIMLCFGEFVIHVQTQYQTLQ